MQAIIRPSDLCGGPISAAKENLSTYHCRGRLREVWQDKREGGGGGGGGGGGTVGGEGGLLTAPWTILGGPSILPWTVRGDQIVPCRSGETKYCAVYGAGRSCGRYLCAVDGTGGPSDYIV